MNRDALFDEIVTASGLPAASVVWDRQKVGVVSLPAAELRLEGPTEVGALNGEPLEEFDDTSGEIMRGVALDEEWILRVQVRAATHASANAYASAIRRRLLLPGAAARLDAAGIDVAGAGPILDVGELVETGWQGRAALTIRLRSGIVEAEENGIEVIESAPVTGSTN